MDENGEPSVKTESISTNGTDISNENSIKPAPISIKSDNKTQENSISAVNCYW